MFGSTNKAKDFRLLSSPKFFPNGLSVIVVRGSGITTLSCTLICQPLAL